MKILFFIPLHFIFTLVTLAQPKAFSIDIPENYTKKTNSLYAQIEYIDSRTFNEYLGFTRDGFGNENYRFMVENPSFDIQLKNIMKSIISDDKSGKRTLVFQLRRLYFSELNNRKLNEPRGFCHLRFNLYENKDGRYYPINSVDTIVKIKSLDPTKNLLSVTSSLIFSHIDKSMNTESDTTLFYSKTDIDNIALFEKSSINLYKAGKLKDGIYRNFAEFANQEPVGCIFANIRKDKDLILSFNATDINSGKEIRTDKTEIYAIVVDGVPYIANYECYNPLFKKDGEWQFVNNYTVDRCDFYETWGVVIKNMKRKKQSKFREAFSLNMESELSELNLDDPIPMNIDHLTGEFIPVPENASVYHYFK
ncbi:hypothetical protein [Dysgonomonas macrotermitis]|uniref:YARHG domain-containing protein n=1 Tax=Dysgonomonas macrotermitis TaxID=1346286 RepID=A0A1M5HDT3_9BACT|nr:hypothetical protein [Dysgonomonas macrotermitis]SHG13972.1 hypothetical protein SAMN05444362_11632 [Dysgonomonas macrotermitis]